MAALAHSLYKNVTQALFGLTMDEQPDKTWTPGALYSPDRFRPSVQDVLIVKADLSRKSRLPVELVDLTIDFAEYWPHVSTANSRRYTFVRGGDSESENQFIVRSYPLGYIPNWEERTEFQITDQYEEKYAKLGPLPWSEKKHFPNASTAKVLDGWSKKSHPRGEFPCRKIAFTITSHDQGWGGEDTEELGPYAGSCTWFDAGKEELSASQEVALKEACELAPSPHFRLYTSGQDPSQEAIDQPPTASNPAPLVCSLRTVSPYTVETIVPRAEDGEATRTTYLFNHELHRSSRCLQRNVTASRKSKTHIVTWSYDDCIFPESAEADELSQQGRGEESANGEYVRGLKLGDTVTVWAKSRYLGWTNVVDEVKIDVYWAV